MGERRRGDERGGEPELRRGGRREDERGGEREEVSEEERRREERWRRGEEVVGWSSGIQGVSDRETVHPTLFDWLIMIRVPMIC